MDALRDDPNTPASSQNIGFSAGCAAKFAVCPKTHKSLDVSVVGTFAHNNYVRVLTEVEVFDLLATHCVELVGLFCSNDLNAVRVEIERTAFVAILDVQN